MDLLDVALAFVITLDDLLVGIDDDHAAFAVHDDRFAVLDITGRAVKADNGRQMQAARKDRGV